MAEVHRRKMPPRGHVRLSAAKNGGFKVTIPASIGRLVGTDRLFRVELTDDGILLRYIEGGKPVQLPEWLA